MKSGANISLSLVLSLAISAFAFAEGPPAAGVDKFDSIAEIELAIGQNSPVMVDVVGPTEIRRGPHKGDTIQTEMLSMDLRGSGGDPSLGMFDVSVRLSPTRPSTGQIKSQKGDGFFPADSFFDVFFELEVTPVGQQTTGPTGPTGPPSQPTSLILHNEQPTRLQATINAVPPIETAYLSQAQTGTPLFDRFGNRVGILRHVQHVPAQPSHVKIKREIIAIERKLDKLLRAHNLPIGP